MKGLILGFVFVAVNAFGASGVTIHGFSVVRNGGGQIEVEVRRTRSGIIAQTKSCSFKTLSAEEQAATAFVLAGDDAQEAAAVIQNKATLASNASITHPLLATGSWKTLEVDYSYEMPATGEKKTDRKSIHAPPQGGDRIHRQVHA